MQLIILALAASSFLMVAGMVIIVFGADDTCRVPRRRPRRIYGIESLPTPDEWTCERIYAMPSVEPRRLP